MNIGNFFRAFQPKDKVFYVLFDNVTKNLVRMAGEFKDKLDGETPVDSSFLDKMKQFEHDNDELTHAVYLELSKNFITPFDREDIHTMASVLDDIADYIYASTEYIVRYKTPYQKAYFTFAKLIYEACLEIQSAMTNLKGFKNPETVENCCIKVNSIENEADSLLSDTMVELFEEGDAVKIIKVSTVLENLETVTDKAEAAANTIQSIMIKFS